MRTGIRLTTKRVINHSHVVIFFFLVIITILLYLFYARTADVCNQPRHYGCPRRTTPKVEYYTSVAPKMIKFHVIFL